MSPQGCFKDAAKCRFQVAPRARAHGSQRTEAKRTATRAQWPRRPGPQGPMAQELRGPMAQELFLFVVCYQGSLGPLPVRKKRFSNQSKLDPTSLTGAKRTKDKHVQKLLVWW